MFRITMLGVALAVLTLAGCRTSSSHRHSYCCTRPTAVQAVPATPCPTPAPCPTGQVPPPPAFVR